MMGGFFYPKPATVLSSQSCAFLHSAEWFAAMKSVRGGRGAAGILLTVWGALVTVECVSLDDSSMRSSLKIP